jgi:Predicted metal-dependent hydrolase of the TIM-barrel fold
VPNSAGTAPPRLKAPVNACDSHIHIIDSRFSSTVAAVPGATASDYRLLQQRTGTTRTVIVQPKNYGTDNSCTLDAIAQLGVKNARGIAVVHPDVSDGELRRLDAGGIRGLRFSVWNPKETVTTMEMIEPLAKRIAGLGWHVQLHMSGEQITANAALLNRIACPIVIDHMGRISPEEGPEHPAFAVICRLIDKGRTWVKLAGAYLNTLSGPPEYRDATAIARSFSAYAPERMVWGSDWPHVTEKEHKPDDAVLFDLLAEWIPDEGARSRVLVDNPASLYCFM